MVLHLGRVRKCSQVRFRMTISTNKPMVTPRAHRFGQKRWLAVKIVISELPTLTSRFPQLSDFYPTENLNFDIIQPQGRRFYGKVKKIGDFWVTPDGLTFSK